MKKHNFDAPGVCLLFPVQPFPNTPVWLGEYRGEVLRVTARGVFVSFRTGHATWHPYRVLGDPVIYGERGS